MTLSMDLSEIKFGNEVLMKTNDIHIEINVMVYFQPGE